MDFSILNKTQVEKKNLFLLIIALTVLLIDRVIFNRDLYADGSCAFLDAILNDSTHNNLPSFIRMASIGLLHLPFYIGLNFGITDWEVLRYLYKISYFFPFLLCFLSLQLLKHDYRNLGFSFLTISAIVFYLPNSFFAVGEYQVIYAVMPLLISSAKEYIEEDTLTSSILVSTSLIILSRLYEVATVFSVFCGLLIILLKYSFFYKNTKSSIVIFFKNNFLFILSLIITFIFLIILRNFTR